MSSPGLLYAFPIDPYLQQQNHRPHMDETRPDGQNLCHEPKNLVILGLSGYSTIVLGWYTGYRASYVTLILEKKNRKQHTNIIIQAGNLWFP